MPFLNTKVTQDGSVFWSYPATLQGFEHNGKDPNFLAACDFCDMHNILYDADAYKTLKHMPEYKSLSFSTPGSRQEATDMRNDAGQASKEFARLAEGSHVTLAVDYSRPNSWFRKSECAEILSSDSITHVRRIALTEDGSYRLSYHSKNEWLGEQLQRWWESSTEIDPSNAAGEIKRLISTINSDKTLKSRDSFQALERLNVYENFANLVDPEATHTKLRAALEKSGKRFQARDLGDTTEKSLPTPPVMAQHNI